MLDYAPLLLPYRNIEIGNRRLSIGLVLRDRSGPAWIREIIEYLKGIPVFDVHTIVAADEKPSQPTAPSWLVDRLYGASRRKYDPLREVDLGAEVRVLRGLDMLVWLQRDCMPAGSIGELARFGVFSIQLGEEETQPPYWREVIEQEPASGVKLYWHDATSGRARPVRIAETSTQQDWAFTRNAEEPMVAAGRLLATVGLELLENPEAWKTRALEIPDVDRPIPQHRVYPSTLDTARFVTAQAARSLRVRVHGRGGRYRRWFLGIRRDPSLFYSKLGRFSHSGIEEIPLDVSHMADPFVVTEQGTAWLFYEEIPTGSSKGRLMCAEIGGKAGLASKPAVVLEKGHHLSFPCVFSSGGEYFMLPESSGDRTVPLYRAKRFPFEFQFEANLVDEVSLVDTTPFLLDGKWYFFTSTTEPFVETFLFWADSLDGRWHLHPKSPISSSIKNVRAAGHLFYQNGRLLRPTQDCSVRYGYGITINEILRLTPTEFEEQRVDFIPPEWRSGLLGTHTLNSNFMIEVVDGIRYQ